MRTTQRDIAEGLGISLITVSRALNHSGYVSEGLKKRIFAFAKEREYVPHKASQALVRNRMRNIAVFSSAQPAYFWRDIKKGIDLAAEQIMPFNYGVRYRMIPEADSGAYLEQLEAELKSGLDGAAVVNQRLFDMKAIFGLLDGAGIPYVAFNVDAPESRRLCYIGADYRAGGRLAANFLGAALKAKTGGKVLVVNEREDEGLFSKYPDINGERYEGFMSVMRERFPETECETEYVRTNPNKGDAADGIERALETRKDGMDAAYLIPALNSAFLDALEKRAPAGVLAVLHDMDRSAERGLASGRLTAVVHQNPILQGYYAVKTLEHLLETRPAEKLKDIEIVHDLVFAENRDIHRNHYALAELKDY
jgi:LacI family transcriptional regulator